ncbi:MAG: glycosyltransferase [Chloroflexota bacterium]|nr:MAG: glycosyltransferase [Chloroflexota bacterium]
MRVLILGDRFAESARRTALTQLLAQLDSARIQAVVTALRAEQDDLVDQALRARRPIALRAAWRLLKLLKRLNIELIHVVELEAALTGILAARYADLPLSITCERVPSAQGKPRRRYLWHKVQWQFLGRMAQRILVPSELVRRDLHLLAKVPLARISVVYPAYPFQAAIGVNREALGLAEGKYIALILPRDYDAGYLQAIDVLERLRKRGLDAHLMVIGDGATFQALRKATEHLALPIRWFPNRAELPELLAACDVVLDCTEREDLPDGVIAAMLAGKPIVAPRQSGITEVLEPNVSALLVMPADLSDMALQVSRVLQYDSLAERLGRSANKRAIERFTPQAHARAMTEFFETAIYSLR